MIPSGRDRTVTRSVRLPAEPNTGVFKNGPLITFVIPKSSPYGGTMRRDVSHQGDLPPRISLNIANI